MYENIRYEVSDPVAVITLDRPDLMNAWTGKMDSEIRDAMKRAEADAAVVGIVVTGAGRAFCAGADMNALTSIAGGGPGAGLANDANAPWLSADGDFAGRFPYMMTIGKPIIAAVNGAVAGMA